MSAAKNNIFASENMFLFTMIVRSNFEVIYLYLRVAFS